MAELGSGSNSGYPAALDTNNSLEYNKESAEKTLVRAETVNDLASAVVNLQTELGTDPAGSSTDVKTRLAVTINNDGTLKDNKRLAGLGTLTTVQLAINDLPT